MRTLFLFLFAALLASLGAASAGEWPLWDGHETVEAYAKKVNLPPTKSLDLGNGVSLDLVLIPAGQFVMGSVKPAEPSVTFENSAMMAVIGGILMLAFSSVLVVRKLQKKKIAFSLRYLMLMTSFTGVFVGGIARFRLAISENEHYRNAMAIYNGLPDNEKPGPAVTHTQPFYMGKYTVTQAQYEALTGYNPSEFKGTQLPIDHVSWYDATEFCKKLSGTLRAQALTACLPTEPQWEYACRAGTQTLYYSGNQESDLDAVAWYVNNSVGKTHPVGEKKANAFGLYDMHGNVWQWCQDVYMEHCEPLKEINPVNEWGTQRVLRGGSWLNDPYDCRSAHRYRDNPEMRLNYLGFRIVLSVSTSTP